MSATSTLTHADLPPQDLIESFGKSPEDSDVANEIHHRVGTLDDDGVDQLFAAIQDQLVTPAIAEDLEAGPDLAAKPPSWQNCIGGQKCYPKQIIGQDPKHRGKFLPLTCGDLITAVNKARQQQTTIRAVGSGHSFSNVCPTDGILVDPHGMSKVLKVDASALKDQTLAGQLFAVESGITIKALNLELGKRQLALATLGAYDGQTLAGAISTGTHGSGLLLGPLASLVRAIVLVSEQGKVYQIERTDGITDPTKFNPGEYQVELKQNDDWFKAAAVAMGSLGIVYSYILDVIPAFLLQEKRTLDTWQNYRANLAPGLNSDVLKNHYFEIDINPYPTPATLFGLSKKNFVITIIRNVPPAGSKKQGTRGFANWLAGFLAKWTRLPEMLVDFLNAYPRLSPAAITRALRSLQSPAGLPYIDQSFEVLNIGAVDDVKAYAMELSFDASSDIVGVIDRVIELFNEFANQNQWYLAGPFACRFVASTDAFVAPQEGRPTMMIEMDMLDGIKSGPPLLTAMKQRLASDPELRGVRVHWGLDLDTVQGDEVADMFSQWPQWLAVYKQLNTTGIFNSSFTKRLGISQP